MSHHEYEASKQIELGGYPFYGLIMAAARQADTFNLLKLTEAFPETIIELRARYNAPGGYLSDKEREHG
jgi:hypothetical protein